jgi:DNA-binding NarL/FixJ family response regulator
MHIQFMLAARAALRDGWGEPVVWLREAEAFFVAGGYEHPARRCRALLAEAGAPVPRRGRGDSTVPVALRGLGVTSREVDVLKLVAAGLSNREIANRLVLSTKTVERHLASLFDRTGVRSRAALRVVARTHGVQDG